MIRLRRRLAITLLFILVLLVPSCGHDQQLVSITIQPTTETFGSSSTPVNADAGLNVQLRALGSYIHPPVTKDITQQVTWNSNTPDMVTVNATGLITATGNACGNTLVSATVNTNKSSGNISSSGAIVTGYMTANVVCFTGTGVTLIVNFAGNGTGKITSSPPGLSCATTCGTVFPSGATVSLTATPTGVSTFGGWAATDCDSISGASSQVCTVTLTASRAVTVTFN